jgi:hypothetical protein
MTYDAEGRRKTMETSTNFLWDGQTPILRRIGPRYYEYVNKPSLFGDLLYQFFNAADGLRFFLYDALGSPIGALDASNNLAATRGYKAYGELATGPRDDRHL